MCVNASLSQDGFYRSRRIVHPLTSPPALISSEHLCAVWSGRSLLTGMRNMWSGQSPLFSLSCPAILVLEFWSIQNESQLLYHVLGKEGTSTFLPQDNRMAGAGSFPMASVTSRRSLWAAIHLNSAHHLSAG